MDMIEIEKNEAELIERLGAFFKTTNGLPHWLHEF